MVNRDTTLIRVRRITLERIKEHAKARDLTMVQLLARTFGRHPKKKKEETDNPVAEVKT